MPAFIAFETADRQAMTGSFHAEFVVLFEARWARLHRYLQRLTGDPDLAADLAQETFARLYRRGALPDAPAAWLVTVAMNLLRNVRVSRARRARLLTEPRARETMGDGPAAPDEATERDETRRQVRRVLDRMPERERALLLLRANGHSYRDIAAILHLQEASIGTLLARARQSFRDHDEGPADAP